MVDNLIGILIFKILNDGFVTQVIIGLVRKIYVCEVCTIQSDTYT